MTRAVLPLLLALTPVFAGEKAAPPAPIEYGQGRQLCTLTNPDIDESSGVAASRANPGVFWTHNDSGDPPRVFAFNAKGEDLAAFDIEGAIHRDWEDMATFTLGRKSYLLLADIGDNDAERERCTLYVVEEPRLDPARRGLRAKLRVGLAMDFRYEDGAHDCEAVAVDPTSRLILLVSKAIAFNCTAYALPLPERVERDEVLVAKPIARLKVPIVTAIDISPDGLRAIVLTYGHAFEYTRGNGEKWADAFARAPRAVTVPARRQGEAICYGNDGVTLYLTSERAPRPFFEVPVAK